MTSRRLDPSLIICERRPRWAPILRRQARFRVGLTEAGNLDQVWQELAQRPGSAVLIQIDRANWSAVAEDIWQARDRDPLAIFLAAASDLPSEMGWTLRQIGLVYLLVSPLDLPAAWRIINRHFQRLPQPALSLEEKIWNNLPLSQSYLESAEQGRGH